MKKTTVAIWSMTLLLAATLFAFTRQQTGTIKGSVTPADGASRAWAISARDTLNAPIVKGNFEIRTVPEGSYQVIVDAVEPFQDVSRNGITVTPNQLTDVGEIPLYQQ